MEIPNFKFLEAYGDISIEPVTGRIPTDPCPLLYLILGPTGAGKSSFIEAIDSKFQQLSISKDQLAGYTQTVNAYHIVNVRVQAGGNPVYVIDTPGFSDPKISEIEIMGMIRKWLMDNEFQYVNKILFLIPITETRLSGSRRRTIEMLQQFLGSQCSENSVGFVTTMWDRLHNKRTQKRAESNFAQLRKEVFKKFFGGYPAPIVRFLNTKSSAMEVLDIGWDSSRAFSHPISSASPNLYQDLHQRIEGALQEKHMIESDLTQPEVQKNANLRATLNKNQRENHETLTKFIGQLVDFGPPPPGFDQAAQRLRKAIAAQMTSVDPLLLDTFQKWTQEPNILEESVPDEWPASDSSSEISYLRNSDSIIQLRPFRTLALKGLLRRLLNVAKHHTAKWFKRKD